MGIALAEAVLERGCVPVVVSGPISRSYPKSAEVYGVETTEQMLRQCVSLFPDCKGVLGAAAPCDFRPSCFSEQKLAKSELNTEFLLRLEPTADILAALGTMKRPDQWILGFALETQHGREKALEKLRRKKCDLIVLNGPDSIGRANASVEVFDVFGGRTAVLTGTKKQIAADLLSLIEAAG